jgi:hypothetical protein
MRQYSRLTSTQSKKFEISQMRRTYFLVFLISLNIFLFVFVLSKISFLNFFQIDNIVVLGTEPRVESNIREHAEEVLSDSYFGIFSKANLFLYPKSQLLASISDIAPEIQSISINRNGLHSLNINVETKKVSAVVCASLPDENLDLVSASSSCYISDWSGFIFKKAQTVEKDTNVYYSPALPIDAIGSYATSTNQFVALQKFYNSCREFGLEPEYILIKENDEYEMFAKDTIIYFNDDSSLDDQLQNLLLFWSHNEKKINYEYIDVRFGSNVFYRKK